VAHRFSGGGTNPFARPRHAPREAFHIPGERGSQRNEEAKKQRGEMGGDGGISAPGRASAPRATQGASTTAAARTRVAFDRERPTPIINAQQPFRPEPRAAEPGLGIPAQNRGKPARTSRRFVIRAADSSSKLLVRLPGGSFVFRAAEPSSKSLARLPSGSFVFQAPGLSSKPPIRLPSRPFAFRAANSSSQRLMSDVSGKCPKTTALRAIRPARRSRGRRCGRRRRSTGSSQRFHSSSK
jgi:hypothetical protein